METKEDFTLLNLSKSSSSLSDHSEELFKPESRLPKRKRRTKRRSTSQNHSAHTSKSPSNSVPFSSGTSQQNVLYTVFIFVFCWIGTLTWLVFSLRNQLTDVTVRLEEASKLSKPFPDQLESLNQTALKLNATILELHTVLNTTEFNLNTLEKTTKNLDLSVIAMQKSVADLGSTSESRFADLEKDVKTLKAQKSEDASTTNDKSLAPNTS